MGCYLSGRDADVARVRWGRSFGPALTTTVALLILAGLVIIRTGGDPLALARLGTRYSHGDPAGTEGYDGQFGTQEVILGFCSAIPLMPFPRV